MELPRHPDSHLWLAAIGMAMFGILILFGLLGLFFQQVDWIVEIDELPEVEESTVATLYLQPVTERLEEATPTKPAHKPFARTSADQPESTEKTNERIGERSTRATSERPADPTAEALPSQDGIEPREGEIETTESQYQDGELAPFAPAPLSPAANELPTAPPMTPSLAPALATRQVQDEAPTEQQDRPDESHTAADARPLDSNESTLSEERSPPPLHESLLEGPESVEVKVPHEEGESERPRETPQARQQEVASDAQPISREVSSSPAASPAAQEKPFQGFQRKTAMVGSISRTGRSALNVDDSELGRYQAAISKAVELEWQRNCLRHRDFITPGFLTVRFFVEPSGRVRSVNFVGEMESGEVQKGFTLSSIREAEIPEMPEVLAESYEDDTLELVFRFYF